MSPGKKPPISLGPWLRESSVVAIARHEVPLVPEIVVQADHAEVVFLGKATLARNPWTFAPSQRARPQPGSFEGGSNFVQSCETRGLIPTAADPRWFQDRCCR